MPADGANMAAVGRGIPRIQPAVRSNIVLIPRIRPLVFWCGSLPISDMAGLVVPMRSPLRYRVVLRSSHPKLPANGHRFVHVALDIGYGQAGWRGASLNLRPGSPGEAEGSPLGCDSSARFRRK